MTRVFRCSICATAEKVVHFNLTRQARVDGRNTTRGAGRIDLCPRCWADANKRAARKPRTLRLRPVTEQPQAVAA